MRPLTFFLFGLVALGLAACAAPLRSDVTRFNDLSPPKGETFIVIAKNPARDNSLELMNYAARVSERLQEHGYAPIKEGDPDLIVTVDFGVSDPMEKNSARRGQPYFGPTYFGRRYPYANPYYYPYYNPYFAHTYGLGSFYHNRYAYLFDTGDRRTVVYERVFEVAIQENQGPFVFEGRAVSIGRSKDIPKVLTLMIDAIFYDFPGENGSTVRVTIDPEN